MKHVFFCAAEWNYVYHSYPKLYAKEYAKRDSVIYVNPPTRNPLTWLKSLLNIKKRKGIIVYTPWALVAGYSDYSRLTAFIVKVQLDILGFQDSSKLRMWSVLTNCYSLTEQYRLATKIYWPGDTFDPHEELDYLSNYNVILPYTERGLEITSNQLRLPAMLSTMGCDFEYFVSTLRRSNNRVDQLIPQVDMPIVGFAGNVSALRLDFNLIRLLLTRFPAADFIFAGHVDEREGTPEIVGEIESTYSNAHFIGKFDYAELPYIIQKFDVGIVPYLLNPFNLGSNPNKVHEYFCFGKPVVTTNLPSLHKYSDLLHVADTNENFIALLEEALKEPPTSELRGRRVRSAEYTSPKASIQRIEEFLERQPISK